MTGFSEPSQNVSLRRKSWSGARAMGVVAKAVSCPLFASPCRGGARAFLVLDLLPGVIAAPWLQSHDAFSHVHSLFSFAIPPQSAKQEMRHQR